ncbi:hypothetical protein [Micromonospora sp. NPDC005707]|uniref:hypothetical protein n=1 Tax=Micromonospora sp. NPDC005707 TaxID=3157050 RepID=UPI0034096171
MTIAPDISPDVLESAAADPASPAWRLIWEESCHQGTCYPASALLLPWLARTCAAFSRQEREEAVALAGFIAADTADTDRAAYAEEIMALRALAAESLPGASTDSMFVYLQQAMLGFDGDEVWGKQLDRINDGEVDVQCPGCEEELTLDLTSDDSLIEPGLSSALAVRLHAEAVQAARNTVATTLTRLFGQLTCPSCGTPFALADHLAGVSYE